MFLVVDNCKIIFTDGWHDVELRRGGGSLAKEVFQAVCMFGMFGLDGGDNCEK